MKEYFVRIIELCLLASVLSCNSNTRNNQQMLPHENKSLFCPSDSSANKSIISNSLSITESFSIDDSQWDLFGVSTRERIFFAYGKATGQDSIIIQSSESIDVYPLYNSDLNISGNLMEESLEISVSGYKISILHNPDCLVFQYQDPAGIQYQSSIGCKDMIGLDNEDDLTQFSYCNLSVFGKSGKTIVMLVSHTIPDSDVGYDNLLLLKEDSIKSIPFTPVYDDD